MGVCGLVRMSELLGISWFVDTLGVINGCGFTWISGGTGVDEPAGISGIVDVSGITWTTGLVLVAEFESPLELAEF